jgi:hypothetical protein
LQLLEPVGQYEHCEPEQPDDEHTPPATINPTLQYVHTVLSIGHFKQLASVQGEHKLLPSTP